MVCLQVLVNGKRLCRAGIDSAGSLSASVGYRNRSRPNFKKRGRGKINVFVGGVSTRSDGVMDSLTWPTCAVKVGDEVCIQVVHAVASDEPTEHSELGKLGKVIPPSLPRLLNGLRMIERDAAFLRDPRAKTFRENLAALRRSFAKRRAG